MTHPTPPKDDRLICEICGEPINPQDLARYAKPDGADDFCPEPAHQACVDGLEESAYASQCEEDPNDNI